MTTPQHEFGDIGFALGSVRGLRSFSVDAEGMLAGVSYRQYVWVEGMNLARCYQDASTLHSRDREVAADLFPGSLTWELSMLGSTRPQEPGHLGKCTKCGFYAYWDQQDGYRSAATITGVVEGSGYTVVGTQGFRSAKARILALVIDRDATVDPKTEWEFHHIGGRAYFSEFLEMVSSNYSSVPQFTSTEAMLREFPTDSAVVYTDPGSGLIVPHEGE